MAYQSLSSQEDSHASANGLPSLSGSSHHAASGATSTTKRSAQRGEVPSYLQPVNYIHISDVGDILGTVYNIDTDRPAAYGRFDSQEEQDEAPNVYLSARTIQAEIRLSGSKKAKIEIHGSTGMVYGRTMLRIVDASKKLPDGTTAPPTRFIVNFTGTSKASVCIAVPSTFSGSITGACSLTGHIRDEAVCLVADAKKSRWTVRQDSDMYDGIHASTASTSQYPPTNPDNDLFGGSADAEGPAKPVSTEPEHSLVSFTLVEAQGQQDPLGKRQRARRHVVLESDYGIGLQKLDEVEKIERAWLRRTFSYYLMACFGWMVVMYTLTTYFEGPAEAFWALTIFPVGVSLIFPAIMIAEAWGEYFYKPPLIGGV